MRGLTFSIPTIIPQNKNHHPNNHTQIRPLTPPHCHLPNTPQDLITTNLPVGKRQPPKFILVETLIRAVVERDVVHRKLPEWFRDVAWQPEKAVVEDHDALDSGAGYDADEEVGDDGCHRHHEALHHHHADEEKQREVGEVVGASLEADEVISHCSGDHRHQEEVRNGGEGGFLIGGQTNPLESKNCSN